VDVSLGADVLACPDAGPTTVDTLTFSRPVTNPVFAIMSLGNSLLGANCIYAFGAFGETFTILQQGMGEMGLLMATHWLRVAIVTAYGALTLWMIAQSAWLGRNP
jgi:hypothetical protein